MNFGSKDDFSELILKRKDGAVYTIALTGLEGHSISIGREGNRTVLRIELRADMSHVQYQGVFGLSRVEQLRGGSLLLPPPWRCTLCGATGDEARLEPQPEDNALGLLCWNCREHPVSAPPSTEKT